MLVKGLPDDSAVHRGWGMKQELAALTLQAVDLGNIMYYRAHTDGTSAAPQPIRFPRPWDEEQKAKEEEKDTGPSPEELTKFFHQHTRRSKA